MDKDQSKIKIAFFSTTRAEFGLLRPLILKAQQDSIFKTFFFVGGSHLVKEYGSTINEIKSSNIKIDTTFNFYSNGDKANDLVASVAKETRQLNELFKKYDFDNVIVLGDRYELIPIILTSILYSKFIVHIGGGEKTIGAIDNQIRNMISKSAHLHFTISDYYKKQLIKLDEDKNKIFNVGSMSIESILNINRQKRSQIYKKYRLRNDLPIAIMTYHPTTLENMIDIKEQIKNIFNALKKFNVSVIITAPNYEKGSSIIKKIIKTNVKNSNNFLYYESLGFENYHQLLKYSSFVIGNSSSGIVEVPFYNIPTVNIGIRQKSRLRHSSIIDCGHHEKEIIKSIKKALSKNFTKKIANNKYKIGKGDASKKTLNILKKILQKKNTNMLIK